MIIGALALFILRDQPAGLRQLPLRAAERAAGAQHAVDGRRDEDRLGRSGGNTMWRQGCTWVGLSEQHDGQLQPGLCEDAAGNKG